MSHFPKTLTATNTLTCHSTPKYRFARKWCDGLVSLTNVTKTYRHNKMSFNLPLKWIKHIAKCWAMLLSSLLQVILLLRPLLIFHVLHDVPGCEYHALLHVAWKVVFKGRQQNRTFWFMKTLQITIYWCVCILSFWAMSMKEYILGDVLTWENQCHPDICVLIMRLKPGADRWLEVLVDWFSEQG